MTRINIERQKELEPKRMIAAKNKLATLGFEIYYEDETKIKFMHKGEAVSLYPYSGWHTGRSIKDGMGLENLLKQLKK